LLLLGISREGDTLRGREKERASERASERERGREREGESDDQIELIKQLVRLFLKRFPFASEDGCTGYLAVARAAGAMSDI
jgi:hypothetical protein